MLRTAIFLLLFTACSTAQKNVNGEVFIRLNQLGFFNEQSKTAIVLSDSDLTGKRFFVVEKIGGIEVYSDFITESKGKYADFPYSYLIDFTEVKQNGKYFIQIGNSKSVEFKVGNNIYKNFASNLLDFFKVQRCGYTNPKLHGVCHIADVGEIIENGARRKEKFDVTGGWHDAGDYTKFLNTIAFSTYMMLFSYDFAPDKFGFDKNRNNVPDILEEAKIGLDWLLRANYHNKLLVTQVQNERDQAVGWRLPEKDPLQFQRPAFLGIGKNLIGIYVAALALGAKVWTDVINFPEFAEKLSETAELFYELSPNVQDIDSTGTGFYIDKHYAGKMALGAFELYNLTGSEKYLQDARKYAEDAGVDAWWGWGNITALADYRLATIDKDYAAFLRKALEQFKNHSQKELFGEVVDLYWGSNLNLLGAPLMNILYKKITNDNSYDKIAVNSIDFLLGRNPWGISFFYKKGKVYTKRFHHQVAYFNNGKLPGGFSGGPVMKSVYGDLKIYYETKDPWKRFQTDKCYYRDDRHDYVCNEPTISANATAIFVLGMLDK